MSNEEGQNVTNHQAHQPPSSRSAFVKGIILLILVGGLGYVGYLSYQKISARIAISSANKEQQIQHMETSLIELENTTQTQQKNLQGLTDDFNQLKQTIHASQDNTSVNKDQWIAAEVRYLVKLADFNLRYRRNIPQAIELLKLADQDLRHGTDATFDEVRKALAADMVDLQSAPQADITGIYMRLMALNNKVDQIPLMSKPTPSSVSSSVVTPEQDQVWWRKGLKQTWESLRSMVVVRYNASGKIPLISPEQQIYLYQNWHAVVLHAMSALLQGQVNIYRSSLQQAETWVKEYSIPDSLMTNAFIAELNQLKTIDINPEPPKMTRSLQAVEALTVS